MAKDPWAVGVEHERSTTSHRRKQRGAFYTPRSVVEGLVQLAIPDAESIPASILDPTCGGGAFLLGVADRMVALGLDPAKALNRLWGIDIDSGAVMATTAALEAWANNHGLPSIAESESAPVSHVFVGDALHGLPKGMPAPELVVGNPPFATPLRGTVFPEAAVEYRAGYPDLFGPYIDLAGLHLHSALLACAPTCASRVAFVLPQSVLAARDGEGLRTYLDESTTLLAVWASDAAHFDANVQVCALIIQTRSNSELDAQPANVKVAGGVEVELVAEVASGQSWSAYAATAVGAPEVDLVGPELGEMVSATAGFRDEYYALAQACCEYADLQSSREGAPGTHSTEGQPVIRIATVGSLDPLTFWWGERPTRFAKKKWNRPVVDRDKLAEDVRMQAWLGAQLRPKLLLPTQSKVFEPVIDRDGTLAPVTPVLALHADPEDLDRLAAVFLAPPIVLWAYRRWFGTALSVKAIKIAARHVQTFPRPPDVAAWEEAAALVGEADKLDAEERRDLIMQVAATMNSAYGASQDVLNWWIERFEPTKR